jgi:hypothetical protein
MLKTREIQVLATANSVVPDDRTTERRGVRATNRDGVVYIDTDRVMDEDTAKDMTEAYGLVADSDVEFCYFSARGGNTATLVAIICDESYFPHHLGVAAPQPDAKAVVVFEMEQIETEYSHIESGYSRLVGANPSTETIRDAIGDMLVDAANDENQNDALSNTVFELFPELLPELSPGEVHHLVSFDDPTVSPAARWSREGVSMSCYGPATAFVYVEEGAENVLVNVQNAVREYFASEDDTRWRNIVVVASSKRVVTAEFEWDSNREGVVDVTSGEEDFGAYETWRGGEGSTAYYAVRALYWEKPDFLS